MQKHAKQASEAGFRSLGIPIKKYEVLEFFKYDGLRKILDTCVRSAVRSDGAEMCVVINGVRVGVQLMLLR